MKGVWQHRNKGRIEGEEVGGDDTWMRVRLNRDHAIRWLSPGRSQRGEITPAGEVMTLRRSFMRELPTEPTR